MKKEIKLSIEQAKQLYKEHPDWRDTILSEFTDDELNIDNFPMNWEDLCPVTGYWVTTDSEIGLQSNASDFDSKDKNLFPTKSDCKKVLAEAQLRQLVYFINSKELEEDWITSSSRDKYTVYYDCYQKKLSVFRASFTLGGEVYFKKEEDALKSIKYHLDLWKDYLKIPKHETIDIQTK